MKLLAPLSLQSVAGRGQEQVRIFTLSNLIFTSMMTFLEPKSLTARTNSVLTSLDANFKALTALNAEALRTNNSSAIGTISRGIAAHKVKVANWSTKNRKLWRRKGKTTPSVDALASGAATAGGVEEDVGALDVGLGPKEVQQANELLDKLKKILSQ